MWKSRKNSLFYCVILLGIRNKTTFSGNLIEYKDDVPSATKYISYTKERKHSSFFDRGSKFISNVSSPRDSFRLTSNKKVLNYEEIIKFLTFRMRRSNFVHNIYQWLRLLWLLRRLLQLLVANPCSHQAFQLFSFKFWIIIFAFLLKLRDHFCCIIQQATTSLKQK